MLVTEHLVSGGHLAPAGLDFELSESGHEFFRRFGIDPEAARGARRVFARACLDWSERRHHLAGALGAAWLRHLLGQDYLGARAERPGPAAHSRRPPFLRKELALDLG